jgi:hypothetical protein
VSTPDIADIKVDVDAHLCFSQNFPKKCCLNSRSFNENGRLYRKLESAATEHPETQAIFLSKFCDPFANNQGKLTCPNAKNSVLADCTEKTVG